MINYSSLFKRGIRIALRTKVNDSLISGLRIVDSILPVGRGQRQLILGDRYTGKTSLFLFIIIYAMCMNILGSIDGLGTKRLFFVYVGIVQSLNKLRKLINNIKMGSWYTFILSTHSSSSSLLSFMLPLIGVSIAERLRDRGFDSCINFDDLSKHAKSYRQISLLQNKIPSRDAFPSDIFNVHSSLLERIAAGKQLGSYRFRIASTTSLPVIESINNDITEFIATNVISITDGQFYFDSILFRKGITPSIDSALSVSRIGSAAQCKIIKLLSSGIKNRITLVRSNDSDIYKMELEVLNNFIYQDHLFVSNLEDTILLLLLFKNNLFISKMNQIYLLLYIFAIDYFILYYIINLSKCFYNLTIFYFITFLLFFLVDLL